MRRFGALAGFVLAVGVPAAASAQQAIEFTVKDQAVTADAPAGFCLDPKRAEPMKALTRRAMPDVDLELVLLACADKALRPSDYFILATPHDSAEMDMDREALLEVMARELLTDREAANRAANQSALEAGQRVGNALGKPAEIKPAMQFDDVDDACIYVSGRLQGALSGLGVAMDKNMGGCISAIGGRFFIVYRYSNADSGIPMAQLKAEARAFVDTMAVEADD